MSISSENNNIINIKLVLLGKYFVGKSALIYRYISDKFPKEYDTTLEDQYKKSMTIEDIKCNVEILDTSGKDNYESMIDTWIESGNCYLLVFALDDPDSFEKIKIRYERILEIKNNNQEFSVLIIGNKCDLNESERKVNKDEIEKFTKENGVEYLETSALNKINVKEAFTEVVHDYLLKTKLNDNDKGGICCPCF